MAGIAYKSPQAIGDRGLGQVRSTNAAPLKGAVLDYVADLLPVGPVLTWDSVVGGAPLTRLTGVPTVIEENGKRYVHAAGERMIVNWATSASHTVVAVSRWIDPAVSAYVHYGIASGEAYVGPASVGSNWAANLGGGGSVMSPAIALDNLFHVTILTCDGPNSVLSVDGVERVLPGIAFARKGFNLGFRSSSNTTTGIDYARFAVLPYVAGASERKDIIGQMRIENGI